MLETAQKAARTAGDILMKHFRQEHTIHHKGLRDITTEADLAAEQAVIDIISAEYPQSLFVTEETNQAQVAPSDAPTWFIDPLDGTTNYARGLPDFSVSIAMAQNGKVQLGVVYEPLTAQCFWAQRGAGSYLNGSRLRVSSRHLAEALALHDWPRKPEPRARMGQLLTQIAPLVDGVRSRGSAALAFCCVAAGWADFYWQLTLQAWDVAAGVLILEEAGGKASGLDGRPYSLYQPDWLASNGLLHAACIAACR